MNLYYCLSYIYQLYCSALNLNMLLHSEIGRVTYFEFIRDQDYILFAYHLICKTFHRSFPRFSKVSDSLSSYLKAVCWLFFFLSSSVARYCQKIRNETKSLKAHEKDTIHSKFITFQQEKDKFVSLLFDENYTFFISCQTPRKIRL